MISEKIILLSIFGIFNEIRYLAGNIQLELMVLEWYLFPKKKFNYFM
jgi:hypothetical protein